MRVVIDLQAAQGANRFRGISRYSLALTKAIIRNAGEHEVILALNSLFPETIEPLRAAFDGLIPQDQIRIWRAPGHIAERHPDYHWRSQIAERLREGFLASLKPDAVAVLSLFERMGGDTSIGVMEPALPTGVVLYDLIPFLHRNLYLTNPVREAWYERNLDHLRRARLWMAVSEATRREGIEYLGLPEQWVVTVSAAADDCFRPLEIEPDGASTLRCRYGLMRPFVLCIGGDLRKNIDALVRAFAKLPEAVRHAHQLAIVGSDQPDQHKALERLIASHSLEAGEVVLTGFIPDDDLIALYNLCAACVVPSWYEGFGLPILEAMACDAAVIGANTSSVQEVIGRSDALFDPQDDASIAAKLYEVLANHDFRIELKHHGSKRAKQFSWDASARRAIKAFEDLHLDEQNRKRLRVPVPSFQRPLLACVSPLPPDKSGIADYSSELLPELARHYEIEVITNLREITDPWIRANCRVRRLAWFDAHAWRYDRILYHFGNAPFHQHMFGLVERHPGVVVLHDFFLSSVIAYMDARVTHPGSWTQALLTSHGYRAVRERYYTEDKQDIIWKYPCNLSVLQHASGVIVHSNHSRELAACWYGQEFARDWVVIPSLKAPARSNDRNAARAALNIPETDFVVGSFGAVGPTKLNHRLLEAWLGSSLSVKETCRLVFVGEHHSGEYSAELERRIKKSGCADRIHLTGFTSQNVFRQYLSAVDVAVQLRTHSRGETSAAVLACMNHGVPTIVNAHGSMAELPCDRIWHLPDGFTDSELRAALEHMWRNPESRESLGALAREHIRAHHRPRDVADRYMEAIELFSVESTAALRSRLIKAVTSVEGPATGESDWLDIAACVSENIPLKAPQRQLLVDVSALVETDAKTGTQRGMRSVLAEFIAHPPAGFRVEPVYTRANSPYRYARKFTLQFLDCPNTSVHDDVVEPRIGDYFLGLDLALHVVPQQLEFIASLRRQGLRIFFIVRDLLLIHRPDLFPSFMIMPYTQWLHGVATHADGCVSISRTVAEKLYGWLNDTQPVRSRPFRIGWFHLGSDMEKSRGIPDVPKGFEGQLARLQGWPRVLMVGTVDARSGHDQSLAAFERLWAEGRQVTLTIAGKQGWKVENLAKRLRRHPEAGQQLFWFEKLSDEALTRLYVAATGVLMASEGEGFGLPLIEATRYDRPILSRDIPVFREVAGPYASYFRSNSPEDLAKALVDWLESIDDGTAPKSGQMPRLTWAQSTQQLLDVLLNNRWHAEWRPGGLHE